MNPKTRRRRERALERRKQQLERYKMGDFTNSRYNPLWRWGEPSEFRIIELAEAEINSLQRKLSNAL